jgi:DNA-binding transcriptional MerR regulator
MSNVLRSGEVAAEAKVNIETLRYYERRGLLKEPPRLPSGQRRYTAETVRRVRAIKQAQSLGFTLDEIQVLLKLRGPQPHHEKSEVLVRAAKEKLRQIEEKQTALDLMKTCLEEVVAKECDSLVDCSCGDCPLDGGSNSRGEDSDSSVEPRNGRQPSVTPSSARTLIALSAKQVLPADALAVLACGWCILPGLLAGGVSLGILGGQMERFERGAFPLIAIALATVLLMFAKFPRRMNACSCPSS